MSSSEQDYKLIYKKWYFWLPIVFMGVAYNTWIKELIGDLGRDKGYPSYFLLLILIANSYLLIFSYLFIKKIVHRICGILMIALLVLLYFMFKFFEFSICSVFSLLTIVLNVLSGFILIGMSLVKTSPNQVSKSKIQSDTVNQSKNIRSDYELISQKWYFWIPLVITLIASIPWMITLGFNFGGDDIVLINILIYISILYFAWLAGVYMFISRRNHLLCGILMITISIGLIGIGHLPIMFDSKMMWFAYHSISMLFNFVAGILLIVFSVFYHPKRKTV